MLILNVVNFLISGFLGYLIGRWGDYYLVFWLKDPAWAPHHWIYGVALMIAAFLFFKGNLELWTFSFGVGLFISDLEDFLHFKFFSPDGKTKETRRFWHIN